MIYPVEINEINTNEYDEADAYLYSFDKFENFGEKMTERNHYELKDDRNKENLDKNINEDILEGMTSNVQKNRINQNIFTIKTMTTIGRRPTNVTFTEKATHNSNSKDNLIDRCWRDFIESYIETCNCYCYRNLKFKKTNFKKQFGSSNIQNQKFIELKFYQYLIYNPPNNEKYKYHRLFGSHNEKIIYNAIRDKNTKLICLLKAKIQHIHNIYISKKVEKIIIDGEEFDFFKRLIDVINKKKDKIEKLPSESKEKKLNELNKYEERAKDLINYIKGDGQEFKRKLYFNEKDIIEYSIIKELE